MLPAIPVIEDPGKAAMLFSRSVSDSVLEHHAHLERRNEQLDQAFHIAPLVSLDIDPVAYNAALSQLNEIYDDCFNANWDGHGAKPVTYATYRKSVEFLEALPNRLPQPVFIPDPDGELSLEWRDQRGQMLSVSLSSNGRLTVLYLPERMRTTLLWTKPELPKPLLKMIELFS